MEEESCENEFVRRETEKNCQKNLKKRDAAMG